MTNIQVTYTTLGTDPKIEKQVYSCYNTVTLGIESIAKNKIIIIHVHPYNYVILLFVHLLYIIIYIAEYAYSYSVKCAWASALSPASPIFSMYTYELECATLKASVGIGADLNDARDLKCHSFVVAHDC